MCKHQGFKFVYIRDKKRFPMACVAFTNGGDKVSFGVSVFNPTDTFKRSVGRDLALGRMVRDPVTFKRKTKRTFLRDLMKNVAKQELPWRIIKAAKAAFKKTEAESG